MYDQFVQNRIKGLIPLWEKKEKRNLKTFQAPSKENVKIIFFTNIPKIYEILSPLRHRYKVILF